MAVEIDDRAARLLPEWLPLAANRRYRRAIRDLDACIFEIVRARRAGGEDRGDLLSRLLGARDDQGGGMDDTQLRDEAVTLFVGGFDTPALGLTWAWHLLANHPAVCTALAAEIDEVLAGRTPDATDVSRLRFTEAVVKEAYRLYPPAWLLGREAARPSEIGGHHIARGTVLLISQWVTHRDPRYFAEPEMFRPARWLDGSLHGLPRFAYLPFGAGPRVCIGASFAMMEAVLLLALAAQRFEFALAPGASVRPRPTMTLRPGGDIPITVRRRTAAARPPA